MDIGLIGVIWLWGYFLYPLSLIICFVCIMKIGELLINKKWEKTVKWFIILMISILWFFYYKTLDMQMSEKNLRLYNDVYDDSEPIEDEVIYLEMKSTKSPEEYHTLQKGDTYRYIAQKYGVQLKIIIKRNSGAISSYGIGDRICIGCK